MSFFKNILGLLAYYTLRAVLLLRYRIRVEGGDSIDSLRQKGGILFLANHPAEIDPPILLSILWKKFKPRPFAMASLFRLPILGTWLRFIGAFPVPDFDSASNSYKRKQIESTYEQIFSLLSQGENFLLYPSGGLKRQGEEEIGGASGAHHILENCPQVNVVLVRTIGLWGSSFSCALTGKTPPLGGAIAHGLRVILKNLLFFTPRREIVITLQNVTAEIPGQTSRRDLNRYLENWYNQRGPEELKLVSYSFWKKEYPKIESESLTPDSSSVSAISYSIQESVIEELARLSGSKLSEISPSSDLSKDLGLDSLDVAQLALFLKDNYAVSTVHSTDLTTVASVMLYASHLKTSSRPEESLGGTSWHAAQGRSPFLPPRGETLIEAFLLSAERMGKQAACVDTTAGEFSYRKCKYVVLLLAKSFEALPGKHIGVMLPASVMVNLLVFALQLAGKIPVMINWTLGPRNLKSIIEQSGISTTLTSWKFVDRLDHVEFGGLEEQFLFMEEWRQKLTLSQKVESLSLLPRKSRAILRSFGRERLSPEDPAVILFTSGTESLPKGVPLSHRNILSNEKGACQYVSFSSEDVILGALPPFHSFGFSVTGIFPLITGMRVAFMPNPTEGRSIAAAIEQWQITLLCMAPTFMRTLLRAGNKKQLRSLRLFISGAEKSSAEIYERVAEMTPEALLIEGYGITECAPILTINTPERVQQGISGGVGIPLPDVELLIVHPETHQLLSPGESGLILASGPNVFSAYLNGAQSSPFLSLNHKEWYVTGDLGHIDPQGNLHIDGRLKRFVKIGGEMISLSAIEEVLNQSATVRGLISSAAESATLAVCATEEGGKKGEIHLFTTLPLTLDVANKELKESGMSNLIRITSVKKLPALPLLGTGKIDYRTLLNQISR